MLVVLNCESKAQHCWANEINRIVENSQPQVSNSNAKCNILSITLFLRKSNEKFLKQVHNIHNRIQVQQKLMI